ncbi:MAG: sigma-70 family RNA polymerase sigma factor [Myxococcales bacterium]|nr:sigma-70 family RNA polymerase sigma factor [Myxococcales bacterium]
MRRWWPRMRRWALVQTGDPQAAEDVCQDVVVGLVESFGSYDPSRSLGPWLRAVVRNAARRSRPRAAADGEGDWVDLPGRDPGVERAIDLHRWAGRVVAQFQQLTPRQRMLLELCTGQGLTVAEAARELGIAPATARVHVHLAKKALRDVLGEDSDEILQLVRHR